MPLGASRITLLAKTSVVAAAEIIRKKRDFFGVGSAQIDTAQSQFGTSSLLLGSGGVNGSDYIEHTASGLINTDNNGTLTIEMWLRPQATQAYNGIFDASPNATGGIRQYGAAGNLVAKVQQEASGASTGTWTAGTWTHFAVTYDNGTIKTYRDGTLQDTGSYTGGIEDKGAFIIGAINRGGAGYFSGHVDEFRISDNIRYTGSFTPSTSPFVNDQNTKCLLHFEGTDGQKYFEDDNDMARNLTYYSDAYATNTELLIPFDRRFRYQDLSHNVNSGNSSPSTISGLSGNTTSLDTTNVKWDNYAGSISFAQGGIVLKATPNTSFPSAASGTYVVEGWFRATSSVGNNNWALSSGDSGGRWLFGINNTTSYTFGSENNVGIGTGWHHIAIVCDGGSKRFYTDGIYKGVWVSGNTGFSTLHIGQFNDGDSNDFRGNIQDLRVTIGSNRGYTGTNTGSANFTLPSALVTSDTAAQTSGNAQIDTAQSYFGGASALFDGTGDYLTVSKNISLTDFTVEAWIRMSAVSGNCPIYANDDFMLSVADLSGGYYRFQFFDGSSNVILANAFTTLNTWVHFALVRSGSTVTGYVDGTSVGSATWSNTVNSDINYIGWNGNQWGFNTFFFGHIDEVRISDSARYTSGFTPDTTPFQWDSNTTLLMHMDGTDGSTVFPTDFGISVAQGGT